MTNFASIYLFSLIDRPSSYSDAARDFSDIPPKKWQPTASSQKAKYERLISYSHPVQPLNVTPDDCAILPYTHYTKSVPKTDDAKMKHKMQMRRIKERRDVVDEEAKKSEFSTMLDGFILLEGCGGVQLPDEGRKADVSGQGLGGIVEEDLDYYTRLEYVDAGDNNLEMRGFGRLQRLRELRLQCNAISKLSGITQAINDGQFQRLATLDLSYNDLEFETFEDLQDLPALADLDVTYNMLKMLPAPKIMGGFTNLKVFKAANNGFESDSILVSLSACPQLMYIDLSYNYLQRIPKDVIEEGCFTHLQTLNLTYNYIADEEELLPAVLIERLTRLLVCGNPLCGPTGEDESGECVDRVIDASIEARDGWGDHELVIITTKVDVGGSDGRGPSRKKKALYGDLQMSAVVEDGLPTAAEWRKAGELCMKAKMGGRSRFTYTEHLFLFSLPFLHCFPISFHNKNFAKPLPRRERCTTRRKAS